MNQSTSTGHSWNGPICLSCNRGYTVQPLVGGMAGMHRCDPADLLARIAYLQGIIDAQSVIGSNQVTC